jgi:PAS domain S-box-containing protein
MNNNYSLYGRSYDENLYKNTSSRVAEAAADASMSGIDMTSMHNMMPHNGLLHVQASSQNSMKDQSRSNQDMDNYSEDANKMRRMSVVEFGAQHPSAGTNPFMFDPSLSGALDPGLTGDMQSQLNGQFQKSTGAGPELAVDTQFANVMDFNNLASNNTNFTSPLDMDLTGQYLDNNNSMGLALDMDMLNNEMNAMNDMFTSQQYGSPIITSPMTATFDPSTYAPAQDSSGGMIDSSHILPNQPNNSSNMQMQNASADSSNFQSQGVGPAHPQKASDMPRPSTTSSSSKRHNQPSSPTTFRNISLPWSDPPGGWPSTMEGAKPHMQSSKYRDVYAPSGFDLMKTLFRVVSRPNAEINLGAVDLSCAFVVCDARSHDVPIIYCSESFERLTGYTKYEITGQNCRFLQSPDGKVKAGIKRKYCDDNSVLYLKNSIAQQTESQVSLINYRKGGQPFMNLLTMIPIRDEFGEVFQFVGFQVDLVENPHAVNSRNPDGSYAVNYQRHESLPPYLLPTSEQNLISDYGQSVSRDEVTTVLHAIASTGDNDLSRRMLDKVLLENSDDVIHVLSLKGLFLYLSPSCRKVLEYTPSELIGNSLSSVCHPSDIVPVTRELKETQNGNSVSVVFRIRRKASGYVWFESHGSLHTEQGKGRKCIILVGRERPVYTLAKQVIMSSGGIGDHEIWSKMSTTGMFLYVSNHVKGLLDRQQEELVGTNIQSIMRPETKKEFDRVLQMALSGQSVQVKHDLMNRRGMVHQAHTWLYPGDAVEGQKPTFLIAQTRLLKYNNRGSNRQHPKLQTESNMGSSMGIAVSVSGSLASTGGTTPRSADFSDKYNITSGAVVSQAGINARPIGRQDASLASDENAFEELKTTRSSSWQYELRQLERRNRVLAEEVQQLLVAKKKRKRRRGAGLLQKDCANCHTTNTPEWRRGPSGNRDLCNSCGLRWAKQVRATQFLGTEWQGGLTTPTARSSFTKGISSPCNISSTWNVSSPLVL